MAIFCFCSGPLKTALWFEPRFICFALSNPWCLHSISLYIMFKCKQPKFVSLHWKFLNNSSACYNFKDVSRQLQMTFRKKLCAANYQISSPLWQMVLAFWPQFSLCFANQLPGAWEYTFSWAKYSKVDTNLGLPAFSSKPALGHMSFENSRFLLCVPNLWSFGCWEVSVVVYTARSKPSFGNNSSLAMGQHASTFRANCNVLCSVPPEWPVPSSSGRDIG